MKSDGVLILKQASILHEETLCMNPYEIEIMNESEDSEVQGVFSECSEVDFQSSNYQVRTKRDTIHSGSIDCEMRLPCFQFS